MRYNRDSKMPTGDHNFSSFFVQSLSLSLSLPLYLFRSVVCWSVLPRFRCVYDDSSESCRFPCIMKFDALLFRWAPWIRGPMMFFLTNNLMSLSEARSARIRRPTIYTVLNYGFGIWRKLQSSDRNRNNIHNIQTIQNASNQCLLITIFLFRLLQFNYKSNTNKLVGQT